MPVQVDSAPSLSRKKVHAKRKWPLVVGAFFSAAFVVGVVFFAYSYGKKEAIPETETVVRDVGTHMFLPEGTPRIGKISDTSQFSKDPFLSQALINDMVLFYPYEGRTVKAILWRPSAEKIVDVSLVTLPDPATGE